MLSALSALAAPPALVLHALARTLRAQRPPTTGGGPSPSRDRRRMEFVQSVIVKVRAGIPILSKQSRNTRKSTASIGSLLQNNPSFPNSSSVKHSRVAVTNRRLVLAKHNLFCHLVAETTIFKNPCRSRQEIAPPLPIFRHRISLGLWPRGIDLACRLPIIDATPVASCCGIALCFATVPSRPRSHRRDRNSGPAAAIFGFPPLSRRIV